MSFFSQWRMTALLCGYGYRDQALLCLVARVPFSSPSDLDIAAISERAAEYCVLALDENLFWCRTTVPHGERIIRLLRSGELALSVHTFAPNSPQVLSGARARLVPADGLSLIGLAVARKQPRAGFSTPHHVRASLKLGPQADVEELRNVLSTLPGTHALPE